LISESEVKMIVFSAVAFVGCGVAIQIFDAFTAWLRKRKKVAAPPSWLPQSPVNEAHIAWLSAYENRVRLTEAAHKKTTKPQGWVYAYTFAACQRDDRPYPIKVGQTRQSVEKRIHDQCKGTAIFERPVILGKWRSFEPRRDERAIHQELRRMGCIDTDGHGTEWFHATLRDVEQAVSKVLSR
jgi:hypothetical protein